MRRISSCCLAVAALVCLGFVGAGEGRGEDGAGKLKVLVVTGGHDYEEKQFDEMFLADKGIEYHHEAHPKALETIAAGAAAFDVIVLYDMYQPITEAQKAAFANTIRDGKGLVVLHHALGSFQAWPEYCGLIGGRFFIDEHVEGGVKKPSSTYKHDVDIPVEIADPDHFITKGLKDFTIHDETYNGFAVEPGVHVLLKTKQADSGPVLAWTKPYGKARVALLQLGHDHWAYENESYRTLVSRAIRWVARRTPADAGMQPIFNGKDLTGWKAEGSARFAVEDGILVGRQGPGGAAGDLYTTADYGDFDCEVNFAVDWPANSGFWFRYVNGSKAYQADILDAPQLRAWTGSIYCGGNRDLFIARTEDPSIISRDGWNTFRIRAEKDHIVVFLNGKKVADVHDSSSARGKFGTQVHAGADFAKMAIRVADFRVKKLD